MELNAAEKRVLRAALQEFAAAAESGFQTIRECHSFLQATDEAVNVRAIAQKLELDANKE